MIMAFTIAIIGTVRIHDTSPRAIFVMFDSAASVVQIARPVGTGAKNLLMHTILHPWQTISSLACWRVLVVP